MRSRNRPAAGATGRPCLSGIVFLARILGEGRAELRRGSGVLIFCAGSLRHAYPSAGWKDSMCGWRVEFYAITLRENGLAVRLGFGQFFLFAILIRFVRN